MAFDEPGLEAEEQSSTPSKDAGDNGLREHLMAYGLPFVIQRGAQSVKQKPHGESSVMIKRICDGLKVCKSKYSLVHGVHQRLERGKKVMCAAAPQRNLVGN